MNTSKKSLIFAPPYPPILFTGEKIKTFRVTGGENYNPGDLLSLCYLDQEEFAIARLVDKYKRTFETLKDTDWQGHERFDSDMEMFRIYSIWEGFQVTPATSLDVLVYSDFKLTGTPRQTPGFAQSLPKCEHHWLGLPTRVPGFPGNLLS